MDASGAALVNEQESGQGSQLGACQEAQEPAPEGVMEVVMEELVSSQALLWEQGLVLEWELLRLLALTAFPLRQSCRAIL